MKKRISYICIAALLAVLCCICTGCTSWKDLLSDLKNAGGDTPYVSSEAELYNQAVDDFFAALDNRDKEALWNMFAPSVRREDKELDEKIEKLLEAYSGPTDICKRDGSMVAGSYHNDHGTKSAAAESGFPVVSNGTYYWCDFDLMYRNDWDEDEIGIKQVRLCSAEYRCAERYEPESRAGKMDKGEGRDESALQVLMECSVDYEVRFIGGYPDKFTPIDRELSQTQVSDFFKTSDSYSAFVEQFGQPNVEGFTDVSCAYELPEEEGEPRYLELLIDRDTDTILSASVMNDLDVVAVSKLWDADESEEVSE